MSLDKVVTIAVAMTMAAAAAGQLPQLQKKIVSAQNLDSTKNLLSRSSNEHARPARESLETNSFRSSMLKVV